MRWPYKTRTIYDRIKKRFALIPRVVDTDWVWLETYYAFSWEDYGGCNTVRFNTYDAAKKWLQEWENS
jgi:hypothetical protein